MATLITPTAVPKSKEQIAVWKIALAVVAGVILLVLLIFGLYKVCRIQEVYSQVVLDILALILTALTTYPFLFVLTVLPT